MKSGNGWAVNQSGYHDNPIAICGMIFSRYAIFAWMARL